jgi:ADP-ribosylglycohydrolase
MDNPKRIEIDLRLTEAIRSALFGVAVGDALGVPAEFKPREFLCENPVTDMTGHGTHHQPPGTFSDDSSLTFCLAEALTKGFDLHTIARNFVRWRDEGLWTAHGFVFDIGGTTSQAIGRLRKGIQPDLAGDSDELCNGNGSLMRILPLLFHLYDKPAGERFDLTRRVSSITHRHIRSVIACFYYLEYARLLLQGSGKLEAYDTLRKEIPAILHSLKVDPAEIARFDRLLKGNIAEEPENTISGSGYVLHTLEASLWCLLTTGSYREAVLKAVNLGEDTDTTAAVTGGLAGLLYGWNSIPDNWVLRLARRDDIEDLAQRMAKRGNFDLH